MLGTGNRRKPRRTRITPFRRTNKSWLSSAGISEPSTPKALHSGQQPAAAEPRRGAAPSPAPAPAQPGRPSPQSGGGGGGREGGQRAASRRPVTYRPAPSRLLVFNGGCILQPAAPAAKLRGGRCARQPPPRGRRADGTPGEGGGGGTSPRRW